MSACPVVENDLVNVGVVLEDRYHPGLCQGRDPGFRKRVAETTQSRGSITASPIQLVTRTRILASFGSSKGLRLIYLILHKLVSRVAVSAGVT